MAENIVLVLGVWQLIVAVISIFVFGFSVRGYMTKKNLISKTLLVTFAFFMIAMICQVLGFFEGVIYTWESNNTFESYLVSQVSSLQASYQFLVLGIFCMYLFSMFIIRTESSLHKNDLIAMLFAILIIVYSSIKQFIFVGPKDELTSIITGVDIYVVFYSLLLLTPMIKESMKLLKRIEKTDESYTKIKYLVLLSWSLLGTILSLVLETIYGVITGSYNNPFSFLGWGLASVGLLSAYFALYHKPISKSKK